MVMLTTVSSNLGYLIFMRIISALPWSSCFFFQLRSDNEWLPQPMDHDFILLVRESKEKNYIYLYLKFNCQVSEISFLREYETKNISKWNIYDYPLLPLPA